MIVGGDDHIAPLIYTNENGDAIEKTKKLTFVVRRGYGVTSRANCVKTFDHPWTLSDAVQFWRAGVVAPYGDEVRGASGMPHPTTKFTLNGKLYHII
jgi:hypothetical protein